MARIVKHIPTRFSLPGEQVDLLIKGGGISLQRSPEFEKFAKILEKR